MRSFCRFAQRSRDPAETSRSGRLDTNFAAVQTYDKNPRVEIQEVIREIHADPLGLDKPADGDDDDEAGGDHPGR